VRCLERCRKLAPPRIVILVVDILTVSKLFAGLKRIHDIFLVVFIEHSSATMVRSVMKAVFEGDV
jgi:hypothetical protein